MSRKPSSFRQTDVARAIKAAKAGGLDIAKVEIDAATGKITLIVKGSEAAETKAVNPFDTAPTPWSATKKENLCDEEPPFILKTRRKKPT